MPPIPGAFLVTATGNNWVARTIRSVTHSSVNHAALYVGNGKIVEAQPNGAQLVSWNKYGSRAVWSKPDFDVATGAKIVAAGLRLTGTPYNFADIGAQLLVRVFKWNAPEWALKRLSTSRRLQCAQLVDEAYRQAGVQLFTDRRPTGLVSPGDLLDLIQAGTDG